MEMTVELTIFTAKGLNICVLALFLALQTGVEAQGRRLAGREGSG